MRIDGRTVYIGECKVWAGKAALHDAVDQVLGYGTWRDHGLGLVSSDVASAFGAQ